MEQLTIQEPCMALLSILQVVKHVKVNLLLSVSDWQSARHGFFAHGHAECFCREAWFLACSED